jgi:dUTP pyrophosphatase
MNKLEVTVQRLSEDVRMPGYAHDGDAGVDLYSNGNFNVKPGERVLVTT